MSDHPNNDPKLRDPDPDGWHDYTLEQAEEYMVYMEQQHTCRFTGLGAAARDMTRLARRLTAERDEAVALLRCVANEPRMPTRVLSGDIRDSVTLFDDDLAKIDAFLARIAKPANAKDQGADK